MNLAFLRKLFFLIVFLISLFLINGCSKNESKEKNTVSQEIVPVSVDTVKTKNIISKKTYAGSLEGLRQADIVAKISERIVSVNTHVGDYVQQGQILIQLEKTGPSSQYLQTQANYNNAEKDLKRMKILFKEGAVAEQSVDQAQTAFDIAKANFEAAKSAVDLAAPISGMVTAININPGDWVNPGQNLATIASVNQMIIKFNVSETEVENFKIGAPVSVYSEFNKNLKAEGKITEINRSASIDSRSFQIKASFNNTKNGFFKPGMFVKVDVVLQSKENVIAVPNAAISYIGNKNIAYIIKDGLAFSKNVKVGLKNENYTEVKSGLTEGELIVTRGMNNLKDSTAVSIVNKF